MESKPFCKRPGARAGERSLGRAQNDKLFIGPRRKTCSWAEALKKKRTRFTRSRTTDLTTVPVNSVVCLSVCPRSPRASHVSARQALASVMEAPPREKRARAAFFCEKEARRAAKKQRKKAKALAKKEQLAAVGADVDQQVSHS